MPAFGKEKILEPKEIEEVSEYVASAAGSRRSHDQLGFLPPASLRLRASAGTARAHA